MNFLPAARTLLSFGGSRYCYYDGIYYRPYRNGSYEVVAPPIGARIDQLPPYSDRVYIAGRTYYVSEGIYYEAIRNRYGRLVYEVVGYD